MMPVSYQEKKGIYCDARVEEWERERERDSNQTKFSSKWSKQKKIAKDAEKRAERTTDDAQKPLETGKSERLIKMKKQICLWPLVLSPPYTEEYQQHTSSFTPTHSHGGKNRLFWYVDMCTDFVFFFSVVIHAICGWIAVTRSSRQKAHCSRQI